MGKYKDCVELMMSLIEVGQKNFRTDSSTSHDVGDGLLIGTVVATNGDEIVRGAYLFIKD